MILAAAPINPFLPVLNGKQFAQVWETTRPLLLESGHQSQMQPVDNFLRFKGPSWALRYFRSADGTSIREIWFREISQPEAAELRKQLSEMIRDAKHQTNRERVKRKKRSRTSSLKKPAQKQAPKKAPKKKSNKPLPKKNPPIKKTATTLILRVSKSIPKKKPSEVSLVDQLQAKVPVQQRILSARNGIGGDLYSYNLSRSYAFRGIDGLSSELANKFDTGMQMEPYNESIFSYGLLKKPLIEPVEGQVTHAVNYRQYALYQRWKRQYGFSDVIGHMAEPISTKQLVAGSESQGDFISEILAILPASLWELIDVRDIHLTFSELNGSRRHLAGSFLFKLGSRVAEHMQSQGSDKEFYEGLQTAWRQIIEHPRGLFTLDWAGGRSERALIQRRLDGFFAELFLAYVAAPMRFRSHVSQYHVDDKWHRPGRALHLVYELFRRHVFSGYEYTYELPFSPGISIQGRSASGILV